MHKKIKPLSYKSLRVKLDPLQLKFSVTTQLKNPPQVIGQKRALESLNFGIGIKSEGYNIFAMGPSGIGKRSLLSKIVSAVARKKVTPNDWCYIYNFEIPQKPIAITLPTGMGISFQQNMKILMDEVFENMAAVFESDDYQIAMKKINDSFDKKQNSSMKEAKGKHVTSQQLYKKKHEREKSLQVKFTQSIISPIIKKFKKKYAAFSQITEYLMKVQNDIVDNVNDFLKLDDKTNVITFSLDNIILTKYKVNLFVDNRNQKGAPIVYEQNPNYSNLICRIEHTSEQGNLATNFTLIRPGSLHIANGGYLIMDSRKLKKNKEAWEALKNALFTHQIRIEDIEHTADTIKPISLDPQPIPLSVKVILIGDRSNYYFLCRNDDDFTRLFKVAVDFDEVIARNSKNIHIYSGLIASIIAKNKLPPFHASAVAEIIDHSSRLAEDNQKLSTHISSIKDTMMEAHYWANKNNKKIVKAIDVKKALSSQIYRLDRSREVYHEDINRGFIIIKTDGKSMGQVNCLSVRRVGNLSYGHPTRVTARIRLGKGRFIDIQREIDLAGPMHTKAGLIISNFLASRYLHGQAVALSASISFEQIYCWTDGDSASVGELCALLSALAKVPIKQCLAITGSIDQYGRVQAIGGVNEKIEGFFDICAAKGLNGRQGVIIPAINEKNLMLREDVIAAAKAKKFFIYPIKNIDEAIFLLTGLSPGKKNKDGHFTPNSLNYKIEQNILNYFKPSVKPKIK